MLTAKEKYILCEDIRECVRWAGCTFGTREEHELREYGWDGLCDRSLRRAAIRMMADVLFPSPNLP